MPEAKFDMRLISRHVPRVDNEVADALSRNRLDLFFKLLPQAASESEQFPQGLVEGLVTQRNWNASDWTNWLGSM